MTVTVTSASTTSRLTTLTRVKLELNITSTDDDTYLGYVIDEASDLISNYTQRTFQRQKYTETVPTSGRAVLVLENTPITSISEVRFNNPNYTPNVIPTSEYQVDDANAGVLYRERCWITSQLHYQDIDAFPLPNNESRRWWAIDYVGGYVMPGDTGSTVSSPLLPRDLQRACIDLVKISYFKRGDNPLVKSQKTGDASESYFSGTDLVGGMPTSITSILDNYRRLL